MTQILLDYPAEWPAEGALKIDARFSGEIPISPDYARRKANGYLGGHVSMGLYPKNPVLIWSDKPIWQMEVWLRMRGHGDIVQLGMIEVDALTGNPQQYSKLEIAEFLERAHAAAKDIPPAPATIG